MVMDVFRCRHRNYFTSVLALDPLDVISEFGLLSIEAILDFGFIVVLERALLNGQHMAVVLLLKCLGIGDWLDGGVVMIDVTFTVDHGDHFLTLIPGDCLVVNGWFNGFIHTSVMMAVLDPVCGLTDVDGGEGSKYSHELFDSVAS